MAAHPQASTLTDIIKKHLEATFPEPEFRTGCDFSYPSFATVVEVLHRPSRRVTSLTIGELDLAETRNHQDRIDFHMQNLQTTMYQDLATQGFGNDPFEPGNAQHEEIRGLAFLSGFKVVEHMPATAQVRGDAWLFLTAENNKARRLDQRVAVRLPDGCLALPIDWWRQLLIRTLNKDVANKTVTI